MQSACSVLYCRLPCFVPHYLINGNTLRGKVIEYKMCFEFLYNLCFETFIILRKIKRDIVITEYIFICIYMYMYLISIFCLLNFYTTQILTSKFCIIECISRPIKVIVYIYIYIYIFIHITRYSCQILINFKFSRHIFEKYPIIKFNETTCIGSQVVPYGRTDGRTHRHDEVIVA